MGTKKLITKIICFAVMAILLVAFIVGDVIAWKYTMNIDGLLGISSTDFSNASAELQASDKLSIELEEESITLIKNENDTLPLKDDETKLNVFGYNSTDAGFLVRGIGSGSSTISDAKKITLQQALTGYVRNFDIEDQLEKYGSYDNRGNYTVTKPDELNEAKAAWGAEHLVSFEVNEAITNLYTSTTGRVTTGSGSYVITENNASVLTDSVLSSAKSYSDVAIYTISRTGGENIGEIPETYNELTSTEREILQKLTATFDKVIVILNTANTMHMGWLDELNVDACINVGLTGQSGARAIPEILRGKKFEEKKGEDGKVITEEVQLSPSGRFSDIITKSNAVVKQFDPTWANHATASDNTGSAITYAENIYYGYKWYETIAEDGFTKSNGDKFNYDDVVQYPFGHGLSYAEFEQYIESVTYGANKTKLDKDAPIDSLGVGDEITVVVRVKNISKTYAGRDVVQLYYTPQYKGTIEKAHVNLLDFGKTDVIPAGEERLVTLTFTPYDMASYDCYDANGNGFWGYELEKGNYELKLMKNSHEVIESYNLKLNNDVQIEKDPVTGFDIVNRFTGGISDAGYNGSSYAGLGSDGFEGGVNRNIWMTRSDFAGTFPTTNAKITNSSVENTANQWMVDNELGAELPDFDEANIVDSDLRLVRIATYDKPVSQLTAEDEPVSVEKATLAQLNGDITENQKFDYDWKLIETLAKDYNADEWDDLLNQMSLAEMKSLIELGGFRRLALESVGKPHQNDCDGPAGFNTASITGNWEGASADTASWTAYESEALLGCSWDKGLMLAMGLSMGAEAMATNVGGWYAPGVNLHRSNYTARNYEYYSEDGVLSGKLAAYVIAGAKINNLNCYIKHFVCSEEGPNPGNVNTWITEQNLRENYLRPFEIAVKEGGANSLMTAFNNIGSTWAGAHYAMNQKVLRGEWGFNGTIITDWSGGGGRGGMYSRQGVRAGNDLWLNNGTSLSNPLDANADAKYIRNSAHNILFTFVDNLNTYHYYQSDDVQLEDGSELAVLLAKYGIGELGSGATQQTFSWWKPVLIVIEVVIMLGLVVWALFVTGVMQKLIALITKKPATEEQAPVDTGSDGGEPTNE